jgi:hypothetical protein
MTGMGTFATLPCGFVEKVSIDSCVAWDNFFDASKFGLAANPRFNCEQGRAGVTKTLV